MHELNLMLARRFPEKRIFLRSDTDTKFVRLTSVNQLVALTGCVAFVAWSIVSTSFLLMDSIGSGSIREQAKREQLLYEMRLNDMSQERNARTVEASDAQERFDVALEQISIMQLALLKSEDRRKEMEIGIEVIQSTLRRTIKQRDTAQQNSNSLMASLTDVEAGPKANAAANRDTEATVEFLSAALGKTAQERDNLAEVAETAAADIESLEFERKLMFEKNDRIFSQLEDAVSLSLKPLDKIFSSVGLNSTQILDSVRRGYSGQGGPLAPLTFSTRGAAPDPDSLRANAILERMDKINLYRIAIDKVPLGLPVKSAFRYTSGFGPRWGRMHSGTDFAASTGTPIYATADGVVIFAGWLSGYGRLVKIEHTFGIETRYAHQSKIRVKVGQKVSRGDRIGDMGSSGNSTGTHLHYEVRLGDKAVNPMKFIKAANDVF
ncbi:MAG: DUF5930 domain-containing protein [Paracoccaceae bacterium]